MSQFPPHFLTHFHFALSLHSITQALAHTYTTQASKQSSQKKGVFVSLALFSALSLWYIHFVLLPWSQYFICVSEQRKNERTSGRQKLLQLKERIGNRRQNKMLIFYFILVSDNSITSRVKTIEKNSALFEVKHTHTTVLRYYNGVPYQHIVKRKRVKCYYTLLTGY